MNVYIYRAAIYCEQCGGAICLGLTMAGQAPNDPDDEHTYGSNDYPKGPYPNGGGDADVPQHCDGCGVFLENPLTTDGYEYLWAVTLNGQIDSKVLQQWADFYGGDE